jgi:hypothetical protein
MKETKLFYDAFRNVFGNDIAIDVILTSVRAKVRIEISEKGNKTKAKKIAHMLKGRVFYDENSFHFHFTQSALFILKGLAKSKKKISKVEKIKTLKTKVKNAKKKIAKWKSDIEALERS